MTKELLSQEEEYEILTILVKYGDLVILRYLLEQLKYAHPDFTSLKQFNSPLEALMAEFLMYYAKGPEE